MQRYLLKELSIKTRNVESLVIDKKTNYIMTFNRNILA